MADRCECGLPLDPPQNRDYWWPSVDAPDADINVIIRYGESSPEFRRAVRESYGWRERGIAVDGTGTPGTIPWERVGHCWAGTEHPVIAVTSADAP